MTKTETPTRRFVSKRFLICCLVIYLLLVIGITIGMFHAKSLALANYRTDEAKHDWQKWREETQRQSTGEGPVQRRPANAEEPPIVLLLGDYFWTSWLAIVSMLSVIFATLVFLAAGAFGKSAIDSVPTASGDGQDRQPGGNESETL